MVLVSLLLLIAYLALAVVLIEVLGGGLLFTGLILGGLSFAQYYFSGTLALRSMGATEVSAEEYPELHRMVTQLAQQTDTPQPSVAVADTGVPNAFAAGRSPSAATICVTTGLLSTLNQEELEGVLAHELAHIKNRDVAVMTIASFFASIAFLVVRWGWLLGGGRNRDGAPIWVAILVSLVVWVVSFFLIRALSRYREYAADRGAAQMTGDPAALASALRSISDDMEQVPQDDLREQAEMNAFFVLPIKSGFIGKLASTHPPTEQRIDSLLALQQDL